MRKLVRNNLLILSLVLTTNVEAINTETTGYRSFPSTLMTVWGGNACRQVQNASANTYHVPSTTTAEWTAFTSNPPSNVTVINGCPSCQFIKNQFPSAASGVYYLDTDGIGADPAFPTYCDMSTSGGGWTLVWSNTRGGTNKPTGNLSWATATTTRPRCSQANSSSALDSSGNCSYISTNPEGFNYFIGFDYWDKIVANAPTKNLMYKWANDYGSAIDQQARSTIADFNATYTLTVTNFVQDIGVVQPGLMFHHSGRPLSTMDDDNDSSIPTHCAAFYGGVPYWYSDCWDGAFGGGGEVDTAWSVNGAYWSNSSTSYGADNGTGAGNGWLFIKENCLSGYDNSAANYSACSAYIADTTCYANITGTSVAASCQRNSTFAAVGTWVISNGGSATGAGTGCTGAGVVLCADCPTPNSDTINCYRRYVVP